MTDWLDEEEPVVDRDFHDGQLARNYPPRRRNNRNENRRNRRKDDAIPPHNPPATPHRRRKQRHNPRPKSQKYMNALTR
jgi:hypothetical protein